MKMNNNLKAISKTDTELRVANYIVLFGGADLVGESFSKNTDFESAYTKSSMLHVDFEHALDPDELGMGEDDVLGYVDWKTAQIDDKGVFVERVLSRQAKYMEFIEPLIDEGLIGNSSEAVAGKTMRDGSNITKWPLKRDTLTVTPMEPRMLSENTITAMKSLGIKIEEQKNINDCKTLKEVESVLRQKGFSQTEATAIVSTVKNIHGEREKVEENEAVNILKNFKI
jgi:hypothetical protein